MQQAVPSRTALRVALRRAAHQLVHKPLGLPRSHRCANSRQRLWRGTSPHTARTAILDRHAGALSPSRYAEDNLARSVASGVKQYVLLGAGLDTFAYRNPWPELHVFEVDHPATQQWKRELLRASKIPIPQNLTYAPVDFERESLPEQLQQVGFDSTQPAYFAWLGVVPYLTLPAFRATVAFIAAQPAGSGITFDYGQPRSALPFLEQLAHDSLASRVQLAGEPFQLFFTPQEIATEFSAFHGIEDIGGAEINARYYNNRKDELRIRGSAGRFFSAWL